MRLPCVPASPPRMHYKPKTARCAGISLAGCPILTGRRIGDACCAAAKLNEGQKGTIRKFIKTGRAEYALSRYSHQAFKIKCIRSSQCPRFPQFLPWLTDCLTGRAIGATGYRR